MAPSGLAEPGGQKAGPRAPLVWIADNQMKGHSPECARLTLHADLPGFRRDPLGFARMPCGGS